MRGIQQNTPNKGESAGELPWQRVCVPLPAGPDPKACSVSTRYTEKLFTTSTFLLKEKEEQGHSKK